MAAQPANTDINVFLALRSFRRADRHESVGALIKRLRPLVMSIPGEEILVEVKARDTSVADFSSYMGEARHNATRGFPIVIGLVDQVSLAAAVTNLAEVDFAFQIGENWFIKSTEAGLDNDMYENAQALSADIDV